MPKLLLSELEQIHSELSSANPWQFKMLIARLVALGSGHNLYTKSCALLYTIFAMFLTSDYAADNLESGRDYISQKLLWVADNTDCKLQAELSDFAAAVQEGNLTAVIPDLLLYLISNWDACGSNSIIYRVLEVIAGACEPSSENSLGKAKVFGELAVNACMETALRMEG